MGTSVIKATLARAALLVVTPGLAQPDTAPPVLMEFSFSPASVDVSGGSAAVTFTPRLAATPAGVYRWCPYLLSPLRRQPVLWCFFPPPVSGTIYDGVFQGALTLPEYAEQGTWSVWLLCSDDNPGNQGCLNTQQLLQKGFPTELVNGPQIIPVQIDIKPGSFPNTINLGSQGTVAVAIFSTPSFDAKRVDPTSVTLAGPAWR